MNQQQTFNGSIDFDYLMEGLKSGALSTYQSEKTGKRYININVYIDTEPNQYGSIGSISVPFKKENRTDKEKRLYIANLKRTEYKPKEAQFTANEYDDLPF